MTRIITLLILLTNFYTYSQSTSDFENISIAPDTFLNGNDNSGGFESGHLFFPNNYDQSFMSWSGWAISNIDDTITHGFNNQYASIAGSGAENTTTYAVGYSFSSVLIYPKDNEQDTIKSMYISNSTYAYWSMKEGDAFAKKFGGVSGNDKDYLYLSIHKYLNGQKSQDSVLFYLADFRSDNSDKDYIHNDWKLVDLTSLGLIDSVEIKIYSSDVGMFGINTPLYFCIDQVRTTGNATSNRNYLYRELEIQPNPVHDIFSFSLGGIHEYIILNIEGRRMIQSQLIENNSINISSLPAGQYTLILFTKNERYLSKIIKQ